MDCPPRLAKERYIRVKKERDYHRMHHRRVVQEKNRLLTDVKRFCSSEYLLCVWCVWNEYLACAV